MKVHISASSSFTDKMCHSVDGKQMTGHHVLKVVVGELEREMLYVCKEVTMSQYQ